ncbi:hypothetical protein VKT23_003842 [Stygiomarasmius scandens]|uniref:Uncharacterized protein n=1 Tax=Marasmiellus scandens TaxID=2682957 RepID=A0ABR1K4V0_9AGAR
MFMFTTLCLFFLVAVRAIPLDKRDVINPPIIKPDASTVWTVGQAETVTWDTSGLPPDSQITNPTGTVVLGFIEDGDDSLHLMLDDPLAKGFSIRDGQVNITVPSVTPRSDYIIVLMGDSGNASPKFTINAGRTLTASASASSSSAIDSTSLISTPIPITGSAITGTPPSSTSVDSTSPSTVPVSSATLPTATSPVTISTEVPSSMATSLPSSSELSSSGSFTTSASAESVSQTGANAAWKLNHNHACSFVLAAVIVFLQS